MYVNVNINNNTISPIFKPWCSNPLGVVGYNVGYATFEIGSSISSKPWEQIWGVDGNNGGHPFLRDLSSGHSWLISIDDNISEVSMHWLDESGKNIWNESSFDHIHASLQSHVKCVFWIIKLPPASRTVSKTSHCNSIILVFSPMTSFLTSSNFENPFTRKRLMIDSRISMLFTWLKSWKAKGWMTCITLPCISRIFMCLMLWNAYDRIWPIIESSRFIDVTFTRFEKEFPWIVWILHILNVIESTCRSWAKEQARMVVIVELMKAIVDSCFKSENPLTAGMALNIAFRNWMWREFDGKELGKKLGSSHVIFTPPLTLSKTHAHKNGQSDSSIETVNCNIPNKHSQLNTWLIVENLVSVFLQVERKFGGKNRYL